MGEAGHDLGVGRAELRHLGIGEGEVDELDRGGLAGDAGALHVGLGHTFAIVAPPRRRKAVSSTPPSLARKAARRTGSSISNITVATSSRPLGTSGL